MRAVEGYQAIDAAKVDAYLWRAFDGRLRDVEAAFAVRRPITMGLLLPGSGCSSFCSSMHRAAV